MATDQLSATFSALADPTRRAILERLATGPATVKELGEPFDISGPAVSKHLRVLHEARLLTVGRDAQARPRSLATGPLAAASAWADSTREAWETSHDRLATYLIELQTEQEESNE